jgi:signal transduction histidine kinase/CheY-like chemotaxis protein
MVTPHLTRPNTTLPEREMKLMKLILLRQQSKMAIIATVINTTIYLTLSWKQLPHPILLGWYLTFTLLVVVRILEHRWWGSSDRVNLTVTQIDSWKLEFDILVFISGVLWGMVGITVQPSVSVQHQILSVLLLSGISSGAVVSYSISQRTMLASILPMLTPLTLRLLTSKEFAYYGMAPMLILYIILMTRLGQNLAHHNEKSISYSLERAALLAERNLHKAASQAKSFFLARLSHELRTPLTSIVGYADRALRSHVGIQPSDLETIQRNGMHLLAMVNDLLDLARIESGQILVEKNWMCPAQETSSAVLMARPAALKKGLAIDVITSNEVPERIFTDSNRFRQILINLLTNAVNFTDHGKVTIELRMSGKELQVRISDTGIGIKAQMQEKIFEPFVRGEQEGKRRLDHGTGLGLALALDLANAMGGKLWLESTQLGMGSTFIFTVGTEAPSGVTDERTKNDKRKLSSEFLTGSTVLVAEDDDDLRDLIRWNLEGAGATVRAVTNGLEAVNQANTLPFDVILMDIQMPVMNGHEATEKLRLAGYQKPIIALTAHASFEEKQRCLELGFTAYISKPFEPNFVVQTIQKHLSGA